MPAIAGYAWYIRSFARRSGIIQLDTRVQNNPTSNMKVFMVLATVACVASAGVIAPYAATTLVRAPAFDSAVIKSDRLGGNFAYSTAENHAYAAVSPVVQHIATPVAVSYSAPAYYHAPAFAYAAAPAVVAAHAPVVAHAPFAPLPFVVPGVTAAAADPAPAPAPVEDAAPAAEAAPAEPAPAAPASDDSVSVEAA